MSNRVKSRREVDIFSLSFLDIIACGFGAIVLLLLISRSASVSETDGTGVETDMSLLFQAMQETEVLEAEVAGLKTKVEVSDDALERARAQRSEALSALSIAESRQEITARVLDGLEVAKQSLTDSMRRTVAQDEQDEDVGGIPVDSEYIIFIVDTSGSMKQIWDRVITQISNVLEIHPTVKGFQIMNDQGQYLMQGYRREWMPDTPTMRSGALDLMKSWSDFSNSNPVQGIRAAIQTFYDDDKKISLFVFGDEFSGDSVEQTVRMIESINKPDESGSTRVQIHAVGFLSDYTLASGTGGRFAHLMREVTQRNNGTFIALSYKGSK
jgi:hypothetical protein